MVDFVRAERVPKENVGVDRRKYLLTRFSGEAVPL
jgi:hypothetical protein